MKVLNIKDQFLVKVIEKSMDWTVGNIIDPQFKLGAMIEKSHMETILGYIERGKAEGAKLIYGGPKILEDAGGYYIKPIIFDSVTPESF